MKSVLVRPVNGEVVKLDSLDVVFMDSIGVFYIDVRNDNGIFIENVNYAGENNYRLDLIRHEDKDNNNVTIIIYSLNTGKVVNVSLLESDYFYVSYIKGKTK